MSMKINFIFLLGCMIACLLFLSCSVGDKSNSQVTEASALTSNVQENKSEQETKQQKRPTLYKETLAWNSRRRILRINLKLLR